MGLFLSKLRLLLASLLFYAPLTAQDLVEYQLQVGLDPASHSLEVKGDLYLPAAARTKGTRFTLNGALEILSCEPAVVEIEGAKEHMRRYALAQDASAGWLRIHYKGNFDYGLSDQKEEYTRGFRETVGIVGPEGVYLSGSSRWIPNFGDDLIEFEIDVCSPADWHVISQGGGTSGDNDGLAHWSSGGPLEQIYLVGGALTRTSDTAGAIETLVYLHEQDDAISTRYLDATARYLEMYRGLLGTYPYGKFALVENFWETGYGMPSFTLLGEQVIRFPFILHSSYPHEILHNWWGNSVFVDYASGNWCEGLTAYLADHLIQEQRGVGSLYRRSSLQKYRDYVKAGRDFPLREFRNRHSAATEAVGYGKALMGFHMLRRRLGNENFVRGLQRFYRDKRGERASFDDLLIAFEGEVEDSLGDFFESWLERTGAPALLLEGAHVEPDGASYVVRADIVQAQAGDPYLWRVPVVISTRDGTISHEVLLTGTRTAVEWKLEAEPLGIAVDPEFDIFRLLDPRETPPSIGQIFGEEEILAVLPSEASDTKRAMYQELVESWRSAEHEITFVLDKDLDTLPSDRAAWVLGASNLFAADLVERRGEVELLTEQAGLTLRGERATFLNHSTVVIDRHRGNAEKAVGWLVLNPAAALAGMARKLPHYGKYSYLAFEGSEPTNVIKGQWEASNSPLVIRFDTDARVTFLAEERKALAELPAAFSQRDLRAHVEWLAAPEREGRGLGSQGLADSANYIAKAFAEMGLQPAGDNGTWFQEFVVQEGPHDKSVKTSNVVGLLPGTREDWKDQCVVLSAHYDHLGFGWPDVHAGDEGQLHPGANDNASGVSVMLELVANLIKQGPGSRNLLVVAFSAEECGLQGSKHYVANPSFALDKTLGVINLDTVGSLQDGPITFFGTGTAYEWPHIFRGCGFVTGIDGKYVPAGAEGSDQWSFIEAGVPAVHVFAGSGNSYHRPGDTSDQVDYAGLVKIASFLKEAVIYVLERQEPFQITIEGAAAVNPTAFTVRRGVSFGSQPEYGYDGGGMLLAGVSEGSPAQNAGLLAGDVLIRIDDEEIKNTRGFAEVLKTLVPDQEVIATVERDGKQLEFTVKLVAR
ncbi:MAG: aminopeptidase N [Planctomycetota bacterium]|jgi:aminopeptidase N